MKYIQFLSFVFFQLMDEDILPRVEKLKKDRANYLEYQRIERELEALDRKLVAYDFWNSKVI